MSNAAIDSGEKASIILETLICYLREKNVFNRADIECLLDNVENGYALGSKPNRPSEAAVTAATQEMAAIEKYCGMRFGGKHRR